MDTTIPSAEFFVTNANDWESDWSTARQFMPPAHVRTIENGIILPTRYAEAPKRFSHVFLGGCCDSDGRFIAGHSRHADGRSANLTCTAAYPVDGDELVFRDEEVIFGGLMIGHWGHLLTDSTARLWYPVQHPECKCKIVFLDCLLKKFEAREDWAPLMELAGIDPGRIEIIDKPTRFRKIIVPDQAIYSLDAIRPEWISFFDAVRSRVPASPHSKVYFSRALFPKGDTFNEDIFESYWRDLGYHVVHPENCSLQEEISLIVGADELVATIGTLSHNFLFAKEGANATILLRTGSVLRLQLLIGAARNLRSTYVETYRNVLPTQHFNGVYYLLPSPWFTNFLRKKQLSPLDVRQMDEFLDEQRVRSYVGKWFDTFSPRMDAFANISAEEKRMRGGLADAYAALGDPGARDKLLAGVASFVKEELRVKHSRDALKRERDALMRERDRLQQRIQAFQESLSWRITAPLRAILRLFSGKRTSP